MIRSCWTVWHSFWMGFYSNLLYDCLCEKEKRRLSNKIKRHQLKLNL